MLTPTADGAATRPGMATRRLPPPEDKHIATQLWVGQRPVTTAEAKTPTPRFELTMPKAWGKLIDYSDGDLLMGPHTVTPI